MQVNPGIIILIILVLQALDGFSQMPQIKWHYDVDAPAFGQAALDDIDKDGSSGIEMWQLDLKADYGVDTFDIDHAPVIADFDGDGKLDGFVVGGHTRYPNISNDYGRAYAFTLGEGTAPVWKMFQRDSVRSSHVPGDWATGIREKIISRYTNQP